MSEPMLPFEDESSSFDKLRTSERVLARPVDSRGTTEAPPLTLSP